jgi:transposase
MSTSPYSVDLREKVIKFIKAGNSQKEASIIFSINKMTINRWHLRYKSEGHCLPKLRTGAKPSIERELFIQYVKDHPDARAEDIAGKFGISSSGARYWLRRVGFSYKKKPSPMWKLVKESVTSTKKP